MLEETKKTKTEKLPTWAIALISTIFALALRLAVGFLIFLIIFLSAFYCNSRHLHKLKEGVYLTKNEITLFDKSNPDQKLVITDLKLEVIQISNTEFNNLDKNAIVTNDHKKKYKFSLNGKILGEYKKIDISKLLIDKAYEPNVYNGFFSYENYTLNFKLFNWYKNHLGFYAGNQQILFNLET